MSVLPPPASIGIIGGGQLARMMTSEAKRMGYRVIILDPKLQGPASQVADATVEGSWDDIGAAESLAEKVDVITLDSEHIPATLLKKIEKEKPIRPSSSVMKTIQDRLEQRLFLKSAGLPQTQFLEISQESDLKRVASTLGFPCILKTRTSGYDGKGQVKVQQESQLDEAWKILGRKPVIAEAFVDFSCEVSILLARSLSGEIGFYPLAENIHRNHILHMTLAPARVSAHIEKEAQSIGEKIAESLDHIGMLAVELFITKEGQVLVNEIAPRTHNSGHYTLGACETSQFEQHIRAICGLPLGSTQLLKPAVMVNLLSDIWLSHKGEPDWSPITLHPEAKLHLYGKTMPSPPGRKMGHFLVKAVDGQDLNQTLLHAQRIDQELRQSS